MKRMNRTGAASAVIRIPPFAEASERLRLERVHLAGELRAAGLIATAREAGHQPAEEPIEGLGNDLDVSRREAIIFRLREIDRAIERIEESAYGVCEACGGAIGARRLAADAAARRCRECQEAFEGSEHHFTM